MSKLIPSLDNFTRCHDTSEPISNFKAPRGQAGVSILWPKQWSSKIKKLEVGNERIIAITIATEPMLCIINAYMPTINTNSEIQYSECLDIIFDIIEKHQSKYIIILAGDLNGSLLQTRTNKHDKLLKEFVQEVSLFRPDLGNQPTFFHHAHHGSSQIDYILSNRNNLSKNIPLLVRNTNQKKTIKTKVLWEQRDEEKYRETILNELLQKDLPTLDIDKQIDIISNSLLNAQQQSIPSKITQLKGPKWKATPEVTVLLRMCKVIYNKWADLGKPIGHPLSLELKIHKKKLRQRQRMEQAIDRNTIHNKIMNTSSSQMFHRLIRRNLGDNSQSAINCIKTDENEYLFLAKDQRKAFANYYEDLSAPKPEQFDDLYVNLCKIRQKEMLKTLEDQEIPSDYFTSADIIKAIEELNMNKSPDEFGLCAEHLKFSKNEIAPYLTKLFNNIIETLKTPGTFKTGILFPVLKKDKDPSDVNSYRETLPSKLKWKSLVTKHLNTYWQNTLRDDAESKSTLKHMDTEHLLVGKNHPVWTIFDKTKAEVRKAIIKARIVSGTFILNSDRAKFNQAPSSVCQLCNLSEENISHFLLECPILSNTRITYFQPIKTYVTQHITAEVWHSVFQSKSNIIRLIIDCRHFSQTLRDDKIMNMIETKTREMCYKLYIKRLKLLEAMDG
ncbi:unnamed protein product [Mytilus edulis]|uniref:Uncharacterized protein n=1 Tax=Mytilus edulis TaxID=6550 RepID=A0A8S3PXU7_MYTED|nr:unnamed protein product [Mytilus edulis]